MGDRHAGRFPRTGSSSRNARGPPAGAEAERCQGRDAEPGGTGTLQAPARQNGSAARGAALRRAGRGSGRRSAPPWVPAPRPVPAGAWAGSGAGIKLLRRMLRRRRALLWQRRLGPPGPAPPAAPAGMGMGTGAAPSGDGDGRDTGGNGEPRENQPAYSTVQDVRIVIERAANRRISRVCKAKYYSSLKKN